MSRAQTAVKKGRASSSRKSAKPGKSATSRRAGARRRPESRRTGSRKAPVPAPGKAKGRARQGRRPEVADQDVTDTEGPSFAPRGSAIEAGQGGEEGERARARRAGLGFRDDE